jgi:hypothetical protein
MKKTLAILYNIKYTNFINVDRGREVKEDMKSRQAVTHIGGILRRTRFSGMEPEVGLW